MNFIVMASVVILSIFFIIVLVSTIFALVVFNLCFKRAKNPEYNIQKNIDLIVRGGGNAETIYRGREWMMSQEIEHHHIVSRDNLKLHGIYIKNNNTNKNRIAVLVHGYQGSPMLDFSAVAQFYYNNGFSLFLPDQRTHGESEGKYITFGAYERYDIVDWCKYIDENIGHNCEYILSGISMGATTVLLAAAEPDMIKLNYITADCGYTSPRRIFADVFKQWYNLPSFPILNIANIICRVSAKFSFDEFSTLEAVKKLKAPISFIHGEADDFVIPQNSIDNYSACTSQKHITTIPGAGHGTSYIKDKEKIELELTRIFNTYFS